MMSLYLISSCGVCEDIKNRVSTLSNREIIIINPAQFIRLILLTFS